jgi:hypothetical protein
MLFCNVAEWVTGIWKLTLLCRHSVCSTWTAHQLAGAGTHRFCFWLQDVPCWIVELMYGWHRSVYVCLKSERGIFRLHMNECTTWRVFSSSPLHIKQAKQGQQKKSNRCNKDGYAVIFARLFTFYFIFNCLYLEPSLRFYGKEKTEEVLDDEALTWSCM